MLSMLAAAAPSMLTAAAPAMAGIGGSILGEIFGGGGQEEVVTQHTALTPSQEQLLKDLIGQIRPGEGVEAYGGQRVAGPSPLQERGYTMLEDVIGDEGRYGEGRDVLSELLAPYDPTARRDYFQKTFRDPAMKSFEQEGIAQILEPYVSRGGLQSGAARRALTGSAADLLASLAGKESELLYRGKEAHEDRRAGLLPETRARAEMPRSDIELLSKLGGEQRGIEGQRLMSEMQKWQEEQAWANPWLQYIQQGLGTKAFDTHVTPATEDRAFGGLSGLFG